MKATLDDCSSVAAHVHLATMSQAVRPARMLRPAVLKLSLSRPNPPNRLHHRGRASAGSTASAEDQHRQCLPRFTPKCHARMYVCVCVPARWSPPLGLPVDPHEHRRYASEHAAKPDQDEPSQLLRQDGVACMASKQQHAAQSWQDWSDGTGSTNPKVYDRCVKRRGTNL